MKMAKLIVFYLFILCLFFGVGFVLMRSYFKNNSNNNPVVLEIIIPSPTPSPKILSQISPDGTHTIALLKRDNQIAISINDEPIVTQIVDPYTELLIPFNTWSPDDKYFFLNANNVDSNEYLVMTSTGKPVTVDTTYFKVAELFYQTYPDNVITAVTGWAAPTLLIINAKLKNDQVVSYWFDVQTHKFIRLSTYFN